jgi:hypothetical protein
MKLTSFGGYCVLGWVHGLSNDYPPKLVNFIIVTTNLTLLLYSGFPCRPETDDVYVTAKHVRRYSQPDVSDTESSEDEDDQPEGEDSDDDDDISTTGSTSRSWCTIS